MSSVQVRPFRRDDRDQLTRLVNAHAEAVVPGMSASVNAVLGSLGRQPEEFIEDPWVSARVTLVAEQRDRVAAAAHLLRYFPDERAGRAARDVGEIRWLLYWPQAPAGNPYWPDATGAAEALMTACTALFGRWGVTLAEGKRLSRHAGWADVGNLHVVALYRRRGVGSWLLGQAADWLGLARVSRLLDYAWLEGTDPGGCRYDDYRAFLPAVGFRELTRTARGWTRP
jgi:GNAT superfamily N-acetyltransferase